MEERKCFTGQQLETTVNIPPCLLTVWGLQGIEYVLFCLVSQEPEPLFKVCVEKLVQELQMKKLLEPHLVEKKWPPEPRLNRRDWTVRCHRGGPGGTCSHSVWSEKTDWGRIPAGFYFYVKPGVGLQHTSWSHLYLFVMLLCWGI